MPSFPDPQWFRALGRLMEAEGPLFQRLGYAETRFVIRVLPDAENNGGEQQVGIAIDGLGNMYVSKRSCRFPGGRCEAA